MSRTCFFKNHNEILSIQNAIFTGNLEKSLLLFIFFRIEFHFVEKFVFLYYSNFPLQKEHNYIQSLCFTLNLWYWMSHFYITKYFYTAHKCQEIKSWWHFKYIWKNYFFRGVCLFLKKKNKTWFWNGKKRDFIICNLKNWWF